MDEELTKCDNCLEHSLKKFLEAEHTRIYVCLKCGVQTTQYLKKPIICAHDFIDDICINCGYEKGEEYT